MGPNHCTCCGRIIPEGRQVCWECEWLANEKYEETIDKEIRLEIKDHPVRDFFRRIFRRSIR